MWSTLTPLTPSPRPAPQPRQARPPPRNTWLRHATETHRAHQWEIDQLVDGVGEGESPAHTLLYPYRLGINGTEWGFGLKVHNFLDCLQLYIELCGPLKNNFVIKH